MIPVFSNKIDYIRFNGGSTPITPQEEICICLTAEIDYAFIDEDPENSEGIEKELDTLKDSEGCLPKIFVELHFINTKKCSQQAFLQHRTNQQINSITDVGFSSLYEPENPLDERKLFIVIAEDISKYQLMSHLIPCQQIMFKCELKTETNIESYAIFFTDENNAR